MYLQLETSLVKKKMYISVTELLSWEGLLSKWSAQTVFLFLKAVSHAVFKQNGLIDNILIILIIFGNAMIATFCSAQYS